MAEDDRSFLGVLQKHMADLRYGVVQLSKLADIPTETLKNWLEGKVKKPRDWRALVSIASALHLTEAEASDLLELAGHPRIGVLLQRTNDVKRRGLLARWAGLSQTSPTSDVIEAARRRFAKLPLATLSQHAPLPAGSRMPFARNPLFVGRSQALLDLTRMLVGGATAASGDSRIAAVSGTGGLGKTQIAIEFVHRYGHFFAGGVYWLSFADRHSVPIEVAACGDAGCMALRADWASLDLSEQVQLVRAAWQSPIPRLLVLDNCEDEALVEQWRPVTGRCFLLVTSRRAEWDPALAVRVLPLDVLRRRESIDLLLKYRADLAADDPDLDAISAELGDLPLALNLAGAYLLRYRFAITPATYLAQLRTVSVVNHPSLVGSDLSPPDYSRHLERSFALSYDKLDPGDSVDALAGSLLARAACFAPGEAIPRELLLTTGGIATQDLRERLLGEDALTRLLDLGLLQSGTTGELRMHRLIVLFVQAGTGIDEARSAVERTLLDVATPPNESGDVLALLPLQSHLRHVADKAAPRVDAQAAAVCSALGHHLWLLSDGSGAQPYLEHALVIRQQLPAADPLMIADSMELLGLVCQLQARLDEAGMYFEQVVAIRQSTLGPTHTATSDAYNNLGYLRLAQGNFAEARLLFRRALHIRRQIYGLCHAETGRSLNNLGTLANFQGLYREACRYLKLALAIRQQVLLSPHLSTAQTISNLGEALFNLGEHQGARHYHEQALAMRIAIFGETHHDVAETLACLGRMLQVEGDIGGARSYLERAVVINRATLGNDNRETAAVLTTLGTIILDQGDAAQARACFDEALGIYNQTLGMRHPETAMVLYGLGQVYRIGGDFGQAREYMAQALDICQSMLGPEHSHTRTVETGLAALVE